MARKDKQRSRRPNPTGRSDRSGRFIMLPHRILDSEAYASLDLTARALLVELLRLFHGDNNGSLYLSARDARDRLGLSDCRPVLRAFADLQDRGFVTIAKDAHFAVKAGDTSRARCWRLTWLVWPECPVKRKRIATNEWEQYRAPPKTRERKRADKRLEALARHRKDLATGRLPVVNFTTTEAIMPNPTPDPVVDFTTARAENNAIPPFVVGGDSTTHIHDTMGRGGLGWWATDCEAQLAGQILHLIIVAQNRPHLARAA